MSSIGVHSRQLLIINPYDIPRLDDYKFWKTTRRELTRDLEEALVELSENDLKKVFNEWMGALNLKLQSSVKNIQMASLLTISILFYFRKMAEDISIYFKRIENLLESDDFEVCRAAGKTLRWFAEDYEDNQVFLQETLELANGWLKSNNRSEKLFNAFEIIYEVGRFQPSNVLTIFARHFDVIIPCVSSPLPDLRKVATKTIISHLKQISLDVGDSFAGTIYFDCICALKNPKILSIYNFFRIIKNIYKVFPSVVDAAMVVGLAINSLSQPDIATVRCAVSFIKAISQKNPTLLNQSHGDKITAIFQSRIHKPTVEKEIFQLIKIIIQCLPTNIIPHIVLVNSLLIIIDNKQMVQFHQAAYEILEIIILKNPKNTFSIDLFYGKEPNFGLLKVIALFGDDAEKMTPFLIDWFNKGFTIGASNKSILISLTILKYLRKYIPMSDDYLFDEIERYMNITDQEIKLLVADALRSLSCKKAICSLVNMALYDSFKNVRKYSLSLLTTEHVCSHINLVMQLIMDRSAQIRNTGIEILSKASDSSPALIILPLITQLNTLILICIAPQSPKINAKLCSTLSVVAKNFKDKIPSIFPSTIWCCVHLLRDEKDIPKFIENFGQKAMPKSSTLNFLDLNQVYHYDPLNTSTTDLWASNKRSKATSLLIRKRWDEQRDIYLFDTLGELSDYIPPYIMQVIPAFIDVLDPKKSKKVLISCVKNLQKIVVTFLNYGSFRLMFPEVLPRLVNLLMNIHSKDLSEIILRLIGTLGVPNKEDFKLISENVSISSQIEKFSIEFAHQYLLDLILKIFDKPSAVLMSSIVAFAQKETKLVLKHLEKILTLFVESFSVLENVDSIFFQLDTVCYFCGEEIIPYLDLIINLLNENMKNPFCVHICYTLSYKLRSSFNSYAKILYLSALKQIKTKERLLFKQLLKFCVSSILYQNMNQQIFIEKIEERIFNEKLDLRFMSIIYKSFIRLIQYSKSKIFNSRIAQIIFRLQPTNSDELQDLLINLCLFGGVNISMVLHYINFDKKTADKLKKVEEMLQNKKNWSVKETKIVKDLEMKCKEDYYKNLINSTPKKDVLLTVKPPIYMNNEKWLTDVSFLVLQNSPSETIRNCFSLISSSNKIIRKYFPVAFIVYWLSSSLEEKNYFSEILQKVTIYNDETIFNLITLLEFVGNPLKINNLSEITSSNLPLSRYYLLKEIKRNPLKIEYLTKLFNLDIKMSLFESAKILGLNLVDKYKVKDEGMIYEKLNYWQKALDFYQNQKSEKKNFKILFCLSELEKYDDLLSKESLLEKMPPDDLVNITLAFAKCYFLSQNYEKMNFYLQKVTKNQTPNLLLNKAIFYAEIGEKNESQNLIDKCFSVLAQTNFVNDKSEVMGNLKICQFLIELQETIENKENHLLIVSNRMKNLEFNSISMLKFFDIRNLSIKYPSNLDLMKKLINSMRKDKNFMLREKIEKRISVYTLHNKLVKPFVKSHWEEGNKNDVLSLLSKIIDIIETKDDEKRLFLFKKIYEEEKIVKKYQNLDLSILDGFNDTKFKSDMYKLYSFYILGNQSIDNLKYSISLAQKSFDLKPNIKSAKNLIVNFTKILDSEPNILQDLMKMIKYVLNNTNDVYVNVTFFRLLDKFSEIEEFPFEWINNVKSSFFNLFLTSENKIFFSLLKKYSLTHFNSLLYDILYCSFEKQKEIKEILNEKNISMFTKAVEFEKGLRTVCNTFCEQFLYKIQENWIPNVMEKTTEILVEIREFIKLMKSETTNLDKVFLIALDDDIKLFIENLNKFVSDGSSKPSIILDALKELQKHLEEKLLQMGPIQLSSISPSLSVSDFTSLPLPSNVSSSQTPRTTNYDYNYDTIHSINHNDNCNFVSKIDEIVFAVQGRKFCRFVFILTNEGEKVKYFVQPRSQMIDRSISCCVKSLAELKKRTEKSSLCSLDFTSFSKNVACLLWPANFIDIKSFISNYRKTRNVKQNVEEEVVLSHTSMNFDDLTSLQRLEVFDTSVRNKIYSFDLRDSLWYLSKNPQQWIDTSTNFSKCFAFDSFLTYYFGIGNRNPDNILIDPQTGRIASIDLYSALERLENDVPLRLTPMFENALDDVEVNGLYSNKIHELMKTLLTNSQKVVDYIYAFEGEIPSNIISEMKKKSLQNPENSDLIADELISVSRNPANYTKLCKSWNPLW
ncbi:PIKK family atypical protein kinase [Trichomonas vaginalis G3]|uniref:PIKK family atypical protein kinase n=1 Tax=Trichomonas vaginalis (strain ATCC PRA-98 / G3) TaxID=412133 RepID=A2DVI0_TRIV3|nr:protein serine/threonine kinase protein [Trichomonas vaginalis G3]EAY15522.1 PIKK family atypical protein kinase [Trichomonas vaginalis G3]KAI5526168.1 protein serine/threonine kinase protein [Trichomonas vaginalis G3]|eukprot:XP_001327745.1 PIKK family atypical protein kinase [Trichomonas vaginalis G3]